MIYEHYIDQTMRTRNFKARNERVEKGVVTKSQKKGEKSGWIGRLENATIGKQLDNVRKETHVVSVMIQRLETDAIRYKKDNRPLLQGSDRRKDTLKKFKQ